MMSDFALFAFVAFAGLSGGEESVEAAERGTSEADCEDSKGEEKERSAAPPAVEVSRKTRGPEPESESGWPQAAPRLTRRELSFEPPQPPRLLEPGDEPSMPCPAGPFEVVLDSGQWTPPPAAPGRRWSAPRIWSEAGLRTAAHWGIVKVYADGLARVDTQAPTDTGPQRTRLTGRQRVGLDATPSDRLHFGLEFSRRAGHGVDPLPEETRATASMKLRFGL